MQDIKDFLNNKLGFGNQCYIEFERCLKRVEFKKDEFLIRQNEICSFIGFVEVGVFRSFILKEGNEFNVDFYLQDSFISAYTSFLTQTPASGYIHAF